MTRRLPTKRDRAATDYDAVIDRCVIIGITVLLGVVALLAIAKAALAWVTSFGGGA